MGDLQFPSSLPDFQRLFPNDAACAAYLEKIRWGNGFVCPACKFASDPARISTRPHVLRCRECRKETRLTAGTVMQDSHSPLLTWFWGAYLVSSMTPGMSATQFQRQLGLGRYETAFQILHKLRAGMVRPDADKIGGRYPVELDETWIGGRTRGEGRGVHHKACVIGAVEVRKSHKKQLEQQYGEQSRAIPRRGGKYAGRLRLRVIPDRSSESLIGFSREAIQPETLIITDDCPSYGTLPDCDFKHKAVTERGDPNVADEWLPLIHLIFSNLKTWLLGIHHGVSQQHLQVYLNEFTFRFNRRFYPFNAFRSLLGISSMAKSPTYSNLYSGSYKHQVIVTGSTTCGA